MSVHEVEQAADHARLVDVRRPLRLDVVLGHVFSLPLPDLPRRVRRVVPEHRQRADDDHRLGDQDRRRARDVRVHPQVLVDLVVQNVLLQALADHSNLYYKLIRSIGVTYKFELRVDKMVN